MGSLMWLWLPTAIFLSQMAMGTPAFIATPPEASIFCPGENMETAQVNLIYPIVYESTVKIVFGSVIEKIIDSRSLIWRELSRPVDGVATTQHGFLRFGR